MYQPSHAEDVLSNLGFCGGGSFLPERFAKDWYDKIMAARMERIQQLQQMELADEGDDYESNTSSHRQGATPAHIPKVNKKR